MLEGREVAVVGAHPLNELFVFVYMFIFFS